VSRDVSHNGGERFEPAITLKRMLRRDRALRVYGVYDGLSTLIAQQSGCDALWASGLGIAAAHGVPDASVLTMTEVRDAAAIIARASHLPVICDCDTGFGEMRTLRRMVPEFERAGVAAVCIEDKLYPKRNSFLPGQDLIDPWEFATKIQVAKESQRGPDFMVFARLESLIAGTGMEDAVTRAELYVDAGADTIVVHSKASTAREVCEFAEHWRSTGHTTSLAVLPTTYSDTTFQQLEAAGIAIVIYANQALRANLRATTSAFESIRALGSSGPIETDLAPITAVFDLTREADVHASDQDFAAALAQRREVATTSKTGVPT
jgi:phosphoenolpyruvate phosphomutase